MSTRPVDNRPMATAEKEPDESSSEPQASPQTVEFIYQHIKDAPERQGQDWRDLDTKLFQVFTAAAVVLGLGGVAAAQRNGTAGAILLLIALVAFLIAVGAVLSQLRPLKIELSRQGDTMWPTSWQADPYWIEKGVIENVTAAYAKNRARLKCKAIALKVALGALCAEISLVVVMIVVDRLSA